MHERDCSLVITDISVRDWSRPKVLESIRDCFVTGKWKASEDAQTLLREDDQCMYCNNNNNSNNNNSGTSTNKITDQFQIQLLFQKL